MANLMKFTNIAQMLAYYYGPTASVVQKADDPYISTTSGNYNAIYGPRIFRALNFEAGVFAALPKPAYGQSGWRAATTRPASSWSGVAQTGSIPDTLRYTFTEISAIPKTLMNTFDVSAVQQVLSSTDDAVGMAELRMLHGVFHKEMINVDLCLDFNTLSSNRLESIDRMTASSGERSACGETDNDENFNGVDKETETAWADPTVDHNSNTARALTKAILRTAIVDNIPEAGGSYPNLLVTGHDTNSTISGLFEAQSGVGGSLGSANVTFGMDGLQIAGQGAGLIVSTVHGVPLVISKDIKKDTGSRIYVLDTRDDMGSGPIVGVEVARPTQYFEAGISTGNPWAPDLVGDEGAYLTLAELRCKNFRRQGKIRDLL